MKTALLFSGQLRTFKQCFPSFKKHIIDPLNSDIFMYVPNQDDINKVIKDVTKLDNLKEIQIFNEVKLDEQNYRSRHRNNVQGVLRLMTYLKKVNEIKTKYEIANNFKYDIVFRCRCDTLLLCNEIIDFSNYKSNCLYIPDHDHHHGINDRFAFGPSKLMDSYHTRIDHFNDFFTAGGVLHEETYLLSFIEKFNIPVSFIKNMLVKIVRLSGETKGPNPQRRPIINYQGNTWKFHIEPRIR